MLRISLAATQKSEDIKEDHDDVDVEHQGTNHIVVVVHGDTIVLFFSADDDGIDDKIQTVKDQSEAAVQCVQCTCSHN